MLQILIKPTNFAEISGLRKILAILLLACLVLPVCGLFLWMKIEKHSIRKEVKESIIAGMSKTDLVALEFNIEETTKLLKWKHSREFEYEGQMYDVVEYEITGNYITYWCWKDDKESEINKKLDNLVTDAIGQNPQARKNQLRFLNFLTSLYPQSLFAWKPLSSGFELDLTSICFMNYISLAVSPLSPPPKEFA